MFALWQTKHIINVLTEGVVFAVAKYNANEKLILQKKIMIDFYQYFCWFSPFTKLNKDNKKGKLQRRCTFSVCCVPAYHNAHCRYVVYVIYIFVRKHSIAPPSTTLSFFVASHKRIFMFVMFFERLCVLFQLAHPFCSSVWYNMQK